MNDIEMRIQSAAWHDGIEIMIRQADAIATDMTFEKKDMGVIINPLLSLSNKQAQVLIDDLWNAGFRPTERSGSAGSLRATQYHLEDMRRLVFDKVEESNE